MLPFVSRLECRKSYKWSFLSPRTSSITLISFASRKSLKRENGTSRNGTTKKGTSRSCKSLLGPRASLSSSRVQPRPCSRGNSFGRRSLIDRSNRFSFSVRETDRFSTENNCFNTEVQGFSAEKGHFGVKKDRFGNETGSFSAETEQLNVRGLETQLNKRKMTVWTTRNLNVQNCSKKRLKFWIWKAMNEKTRVKVYGWNW